MKSKKFTSLRNLSKKVAVLCAAMLFFANFTFINKENVKFISSGFISAKSAVQQNAFNVSAHINKAAKAVNGLFGAKNSKIFKPAAAASANGSQDNAPYGQRDNVFFNTTAHLHAVLNPVNSSLQNLSDFLYLNGLSIGKIFIDPGGGNFAPDGFYLILSYFLIMLLFFASARKVYGIALNYRT